VIATGRRGIAQLTGARVGITCDVPNGKNAHVTAVEFRTPDLELLWAIPVGEWADARERAGHDDGEGFVEDIDQFLDDRGLTYVILHPGLVVLPYSTLLVS